MKIAILWSQYFETRYYWRLAYTSISYLYFDQTIIYLYFVQTIIKLGPILRNLVTFRPSYFWLQDNKY